MIGLFRRIRAPKRWQEVPAAAVIVPVLRPDSKLAANGLSQALKLRNALAEVYLDRHWDDLAEEGRITKPGIDKPYRHVRRPGNTVDYDSIISWKLYIMLVYVSYYSFDRWSMDARDDLRRLVETYFGRPATPFTRLGCSMAGYMEGGASIMPPTHELDDRRVYINPGSEISEKDAMNVIRKLIRNPRRFPYGGIRSLLLEADAQLQTQMSKRNLDLFIFR